MAPIYSSRLLTCPGPTGSYSATVPAGQTWILVDVTCQKTNAGTAVIVGDSEADYIELATEDPLTLPLYLQWRGRLVLPPGEVLTAEVTGGPMTAALSGYILTAP